MGMRCSAGRFGLHGDGNSSIFKGSARQEPPASPSPCWIVVAGHRFNNLVLLSPRAVLDILAIHARHGLSAYYF
jgi:hypothetical protein